MFLFKNLIYCYVTFTYISFISQINLLHYGTFFLITEFIKMIGRQLWMKDLRKAIYSFILIVPLWIKQGLITSDLWKASVDIAEPRPQPLIAYMDELNTNGL